ncbi:hypothetical protein GCM10010923_07030 [Blastomonas marina]|uniref:Secreted protein n=1 Tax=Blastomonas marina TaxID=1867408 RepID=A0ABQ1F6J5_9SPHN|nr:hypothetical protein GCM10010923_07030 [Blastomonas marina]
MVVSMEVGLLSVLSVMAGELGKRGAGRNSYPRSTAMFDPRIVCLNDPSFPLRPRDRSVP